MVLVSLGDRRNYFHYENKFIIKDLTESRPNVKIFAPLIKFKNSNYCLTRFQYLIIDKITVKLLRIFESLLDLILRYFQRRQFHLFA